MAGFEQEFKDAEASKHERADNPSSEASDSSAESSESSESSNPRKSTTCSTKLRIR